MDTYMNQGPPVRPREIFNCDVVSSHSDFDVRLGGYDWSAAWFNLHECFDVNWHEVFSLDATDNIKKVKPSLDGSEMSVEDKMAMLDGTKTFYSCENEVQGDNGMKKMCGKYCCKDRMAINIVM